MAVTYSSNAAKDSHIFSLTIDTNESCTESFSGTSASAPAASAIFALALEANPRLTWRDIEYLIVHTAKDPWTGRVYSDELGFGVLDAHTFVSAAQTWTPVPPSHGSTPPPSNSTGAPWTTTGLSTGASGLIRRHFGRVEKVEVRVWVKHQKRGDVEVTLFSPGGRESRLGTRRREDRAWSGLRGWTFMSVKHWGENPVGEWTLKVNDQRERHLRKAKGRLIGFSVTFWGCTNEKGWDRLYEMPGDDYDVFPPPGRYASRVGSDNGEGEGEEGEGITVDYSFDSD